MNVHVGIIQRNQWDRNSGGEIWSRIDFRDGSFFILQWRFPPSSTGRMWTLSYEQIIYRYFECFTYSSTFGWLLINRQQDWERSNCLYRSSSRDVHSGLQPYLRLFGKWRREDIFKRMHRMFWFRCCKLQTRNMWIMHSLHWGRGRIQYRFTSGHPNVGVNSYCLTGRASSDRLSPLPASAWIGFQHMTNGRFSP